MKLNKHIDHTNLNPTATEEAIRKLCAEAIQYDFASVCVHPCRVALAKSLLKDSDVAIGTVIGFPLGANTTETKVFEIEKAIADGADELDAVINIGKIKDNDFGYIEREVMALYDASFGHILKIIIEISYLTPDEIIKMCEICNEVMVDFIKTSTGFSSHGATPEAVALMKENAEQFLEIKASGGIRTYEAALKYIELGATRIGTSNGVKIMEEMKEKGE